MADLVAVGFKASPETRDRLKTWATKLGLSVSALIVDAVESRLTAEDECAEIEARGGYPTTIDRPAATGPDPQVVLLQAENAKLVEDRDKWRALAKAAMPMADEKPVRRGSDPMGRREHAAGPVLASAVPDVPGTVAWSGLKATKPGRG